MKLRKKILLSIVLTLSAFCYADQVAVINEDFEALALGDTTPINGEIKDASHDTGLRVHNHLVGEIVAPNVAFSIATGKVLQLTTGNNPNGGYGLVSANNSPRQVFLLEGDELTLSFDIYVQAVPATAEGVTLSLVLGGVDNVSRSFTELTGASVGDVVHVSWTTVVTAGMTNATTVSPNIAFEGAFGNFSTEGPNGNGTQLQIAQIDNVVLEVPDNEIVHVPADYYLDADGGNDANTGASPEEAWATLSKASEGLFRSGDRIFLQSGDRFSGNLVFSGDLGSEETPILVTSYGPGAKPVIDAAGYLAGVHIIGGGHIEVSNLEITSDGGAPLDGSNEGRRYGVYTQSTEGITLSNLDIHTIYPFVASAHEGRNPTTYLGVGVSMEGSKDIVMKDCDLENVGFHGLTMGNLDNIQILDNVFENIGGPAMVPNTVDDLIVRGNVVDHSGAYTDPRMHGRGSGIWPIRCNRVLIEKNRFMHARGRYDSCGVHIDIGNTDVIIQYNLTIDNEGGFVEILGDNMNCAYRYNISINDGARKGGLNENGLPAGDGHVLLFAGTNFDPPGRRGPFNSYVYNNTIFVKEDQHASLSIEQYAEGIVVANNLFYIEPDTEDGTPDWWANYPAGIEDTVFWQNNLYQRGKVFPEDWIFYEADPIYGNPKLANPGGLTAEDYIPQAGSIVEGRSIEIPQIPGDSIGLREGFEVTEDFFGNPIQGIPDIGAVEIGGGVSNLPGSAFWDLPAAVHGGDIEMTAAPAPAGGEYYFKELSGNFGGSDSGWQSSNLYVDTDLLPNTSYSYEVIVRNGDDVSGDSSVVASLINPENSPFPNHIVLDEDFSSRPNPANANSPFPVNTWYLDGSELWSAEDQNGSVLFIAGKGMQLGFGFDEVVLQYSSDRLWDLTRDYQFSGDWRIDKIFPNSQGIIVGFGEHDPVSGELLRRIKEVTVGELVSPVAGMTGSFNLSVTAAELQAAGVSATSRVGVFVHRDDDGELSVQSEDKSDMYNVNNLLLRFFGGDVDSDSDGIPDDAEVAVGLDPQDPIDASGDLDGDGTSNEYEYLFGTDIDVSNAGFAVEMDPDGSFAEVVIPGDQILSGRVYILEHTMTLSDPDGWKPVGSLSGTTAAGTGDYRFVVPNDADWSFYRVRVEWE